MSLCERWCEKAGRFRCRRNPINAGQKKKITVIIEQQPLISCPGKIKLKRALQEGQLALATG